MEKKSANMSGKKNAKNIVGVTQCSVLVRRSKVAEHTYSTVEHDAA